MEEGASITSRCSGNEPAFLPEQTPLRKDRESGKKRAYGRGRSGQVSYPLLRSWSFARKRPWPGVTSPIPIENPRLPNKWGENTNKWFIFSIPTLPFKIKSYKAMVNREPMVKKRINPFYEAFRQRSVKFERLPKSLLYDDRGRFTPNECSLGSSLRPRVKKGMYGQLTLNLLSKNNSLRVPPLPPPPLPKKTNSPPNPARRRKTSDHKMGYCVTFGKLPPPRLKDKWNSL